MIGAHDIEVVLLDEPAIVVRGHRRPVRRPREQALLTRLALAAPRAVPVGSLIDDIWGEATPGKPLDALRVYVSNLRKLLEGGGRRPDEVLVTTPGAYALDVSPGDVDVNRAERALAEGDADVLRATLEAWPEHDLGQLEAGSGFFAGTDRRLTELRTGAFELIAGRDVAAGRFADALPTIDELTRRAPYRERPWQLLVQSLAGLGRRTEAVRAAQRARRTLAEVGIEPGTALADAERAALDGAPTDAGPREALPRPDADYVEVDGSRIAFATMGGGGRDLLFLHGGFVPFEVMPDEPRFRRFLAELASRYRVIVLDRRGIGMSDPPADGAPPSLDHWVADTAAVLDAVGSTEALVLAHENGGPVALRLAAEQPRRVRGLVLHSTVARFLRSDDHPYGPTEEVWSRIDQMIDRSPGADDVLALVAPSVGEDPDLRAWLDRAGRLGAGPSRARELHRLYLEADVRHVLPEVRAPAIVLQPARRIRSDPGQARYLAEQLPAAELQLLDSADHLPFLADADAVLAAVARIDARTRTAAPPPKQLRALVAVTPPLSTDALVEHGAETCVVVDDALVATFRSRGAADAARSAVRRTRPDTSVVVIVADTAGTADDEAVLDAAAAVHRS